MNVKTMPKPGASFLSALVLLFSGCTAIQGPTPEEEVLAMLDTYHVAELAKDVSTMTEAFSNNFSNSQGATKAVLQQFFQGLVDYGALDNLKINMDNAEVAIDGDTATIKGVSYTSSMGTATYVYTLQREADGIWRFVTSEVSM